MGAATSAVSSFVSGTRARETWGLVLDEAIALGLPMVLPRFGAYPEHAGEGRGALDQRLRALYRTRETTALDSQRNDDTGRRQ